MFRLYVGLLKNDEWYNHTECHPLKGGVIALMDSKGKSGPSRFLQLAKQSIKSLFTADGKKEYKLTEQDYLDLAFDDARKINRETMKVFSGEKYPMFEESFFCSRCSRSGREKYTTVCESWDKLVEDGIIDEVFLESPDEIRRMVKLPSGIIVEEGQNKQIRGGVFDEVWYEQITIGEAIQINESQFAMETEANMLCAMWDLCIKEIGGMSDRELNILRRNPRESFTKRYLTDQADIQAFGERPEAGMKAEFRKVVCSHCQNQIGGWLDETNFFSFYSQKSASPK